MSAHGSILSLSGRVDRNTSKTITASRRSSVLCRTRLVLPVVLLVLITAAHAQSYYYVDCSGTNPNDFPTIGTALSVAGPNSYVIVTGERSAL